MFVYALFSLGQVLVEVAYSGVCHTQVGEARGHRGEDKFLPHGLGHEGSGIVREVSAGAAEASYDRDYRCLSTLLPRVPWRASTPAW